MFVFSGVQLGVEFQGHPQLTLLLDLESAELSSRADSLFHIPASSAGGSHSLQPRQHLLVSAFFIITTPMGVK